MSTSPNTYLHRRTFLTAAAGITATALGITGCGSREPDTSPVDISDSDDCASCGMLISDRRFAAEIIGPDDVWKFDDIGELFTYHRKKRFTTDQIVAMWVIDYRSRKWVSATSAHYLIDEKITTPMGTHVVAFSTAEAAKAQSEEGRVTTFDDLLKNPPQTMASDSADAPHPPSPSPTDGQ